MKIHPRRGNLSQSRCFNQISLYDDDFFNNAMITFSNLALGGKTVQNKCSYFENV